ncbi:hypothetical protein EJB05_36617 [Eragrostis curvula]|uniref:Uncharacterized protein n=1 Tax=Eragrostis curvula TaxID=38414 RepID=A0A5J9UB49_9POAL|nr:hypothetical protein EJB05_36617 [Eragrostis curvula]
MMPKLKFIITVILGIFLLLNASSGQTATTQDKNEVPSEVVETHAHRALTDLQDYDYGGSNSKHDPRRKPGGGH